LTSKFTYEILEAIAKDANKRLPTAKELTDWIASKGKGVLAGDQWAPIRNIDGSKDYI